MPDRQKLLNEVQPSEISIPISNKPRKITCRTALVSDVHEDDKNDVAFPHLFYGRTMRNPDDQDMRETIALKCFSRDVLILGRLKVPQVSQRGS